MTTTVIVLVALAAGVAVAVVGSLIHRSRQRTLRAEDKRFRALPRADLEKLLAEIREDRKRLGIDRP